VVVAVVATERRSPMLALMMYVLSLSPIPGTLDGFPDPPAMSFGEASSPALHASPIPGTLDGFPDPPAMSFGEASSTALHAWPLAARGCEEHGPRLDGTYVTICGGSVRRVRDRLGNVREWLPGNRIAFRSPGAAPVVLGPDGR
jgi:hypothetical protein